MRQIVLWQKASIFYWLFLFLTPLFNQAWSGETRLISLEGVNDWLSQGSESRYTEFALAKATPKGFGRLGYGQYHYVSDHNIFDYKGIFLGGYAMQGPFSPEFGSANILLGHFRLGEVDRYGLAIRMGMGWRFLNWFHLLVALEAQPNVLSNQWQDGALSLLGGRGEIFLGNPYFKIGYRRLAWGMVDTDFNLVDGVSGADEFFFIQLNLPYG